MSGLTPTLYLPIEETNRELDSKLLIALELLGDGITVIVGRNPLFVANFASMPPGAVLFKGMNAVPAHVMEHAVSHGHAPLATDEEGLGLAEPLVMARNMDPSIAASCRVFFAQGRRHADAMTLVFPEARDRIRIVGNARLDLLRPPFKSTYMDEARAHGRTYGAYVMIDTNFGAINSQWGNTEAFRNILERVGYLDFSKPADREYYARHIRTEKANIILIRRVLERLSDQFPEITFIIRPHPAERDAPWRKSYGERHNIRVIAEGSHIPWLLGSKLMLHTGCTTGLEAELLGVPCLTLVPMEHESLLTADLLSNYANERAIGFDQAIEAVSRLLTGEAGGEAARREARLDALEGHVEALDGKFAFQRIGEEIRMVLGSALESHESFAWQPTDPEAFVKTKEQFERRLGDANRNEYIWGKGEIDQTMLSRRLGGLARVTGSTITPYLSEIADGVFHLSATPRQG
jgi:surface carbohydrate biosynthesis protein